MLDNAKWWFAAANHGEIKGENTGDKELFKKDTYLSLAREILQNSIDARDSDEEPVQIEFEEFEMERDDIPGIYDFLSQVSRCAKYWRGNPQFKAKYEDIVNYAMNNEKIKCLRISDFNTSGLNGIESTDSTADKPYNALVKGTGISSKKNNFAGGSKGVGKNVPFLLSRLQMVFYETNTTDDAIGSVGVAKLASGYIDDNDADPQRDYTQGTGYFACTDKVLPIIEFISLQDGYTKRKNNYGTDIFIIGFETNTTWQRDVINSILNSFMVSIYRNELIVSFNGITIDNNSVEDLVYSEYIDKKFKKDIIAQYQILKNENNNVKTYDIETELGNAQMYILPYKKADEENATRKAAMIRTPLMLIKTYDLHFNVSAMVIIGKNKLGTSLREIENPQHVDWEISRIKDESERKEVKAAIDAIKEQIHQYVLDCLRLGDDSPIDPNGAGEYLAAPEDGEEQTKESKKLDEKDEAEVAYIKTMPYRESNANIKNDDGFGTQPEIGSLVDDEDGEEGKPSGKNDADGGEPREGDNTGRKEKGDNEIIARANLTGVKYKVISTNKRKGRVKILFVAPESIEKCYLNLALVDDANSSNPLDILEFIVNGQSINIEDSREPGPFEIIKNNKIVLDVKVDKDDYFACEVKVKYENRQ